MDSQPFDAMTVANAMIIGSIFYAIHSFVRTRNQFENGRTNVGLAMVLVGLAIIALHYLANLATIYFLPHFKSVSDTWTIMRSLRLNGYWVIIGSGLLCLVCGLHFIFRDLRSLAIQLRQAEKTGKLGGCPLLIPRVADQAF